MTSLVDKPARTPPTRPARPGRTANRVAHGIGVIVVLAAEIAFFRARFTTDHLAESGLWWARLVRDARDSVAGLACVAVAVALIGGRALFVGLRRAGRTETVWTGRISAAALHVAGLAAFFGLSSLLLAPGGDERAGASILFTAWVLAAGLVLLGAIGWLWPLGALARAVLARRWRLALGVAVGATAYLAGSRILDRLALWEPLGRATLLLADGFLGLVFPERFLSPADQALGTERFYVVVTKHCSGYEGILLFPAFFATFLIVARRRFRFPRVLWLLPLGALTVWVLNALRVAILVVIGHYGSPEAAIDGFHVHAGWPVFAAAALGCVALAIRAPYFVRQPVGRELDVPVDSPAPYVAPIVATTAALMITRSAWAPVGWARAAQLAAVVLLVVQFRSAYARMFRVVSPSAIAIGALGAVAWVLLRQGSDTALSGFALVAADHAPGRWLELGLSIVGYLAIAPLVEELAFRGYLLRRFTAARFESIIPRQTTFLAVAGSSLVFGAFHGEWVAATACGALYAWAYRRQGRLGDAVAAHAATNLWLLLAATATQRWEWVG